MFSNVGKGVHVGRGVKVIVGSEVGVAVSVGGNSVFVDNGTDVACFVTVIVDTGEAAEQLTSRTVKNIATSFFITHLPLIFS